MTPETIAKLCIIVPLWGVAIGFVGIGIDMLSGYRLGSWTNRVGNWGIAVALASVGFLTFVGLLACTIKAFA